jgi:hypothetical protein
VSASARRGRAGCAGCSGCSGCAGCSGSAGCVLQHNTEQLFLLCALCPVFCARAKCWRRRTSVAFNAAVMCACACACLRVQPSYTQHARAPQHSGTCGPPQHLACLHPRDRRCAC